MEWPWSLPSLELCSPVSTGLHLHPPHPLPPPQESLHTLSARLLASIATKERGAEGGGVGGVGDRAWRPRGVEWEEEEGREQHLADVPWWAAGLFLDRGSPGVGE